MRLLKEDLYKIRYAILIILIYFVITQIVFKTVCPSRILFGLECPACGLTRASFSLLLGNVSKAIEYNPTVFAWWTIIILGFINRYIYNLKIKVFPVGVIMVSIITIGWFLIIKI